MSRDPIVDEVRRARETEAAKHAFDIKAILAAEIIKALDRERLTVRAAHSRTVIAAADFSRIRNANLGRFTVDRLMSILNRLGARIVVKIRLYHAQPAAYAARL